MDQPKCTLTQCADYPAGVVSCGVARVAGPRHSDGIDAEQTIAGQYSIALRVLAGPGVKPRGSIDGEAEMFTGSHADWVTDITLWLASALVPWTSGCLAADPTLAWTRPSTICVASVTAC